MENSRVIIITKATASSSNKEYFGVARNVENAEKIIRQKYPDMRQICVFRYSSDENNEFIFFLKEEKIS